MEPIVIDSLEFAQNGRHLSGDVQLAGFGRLAESLFDRQKPPADFAGEATKKGVWQSHETIPGRLFLSRETTRS